MSRAECTRSWEAEALVDRRLDGADRASFERHIGACAACKGELAAIRAVDLTMDAASVDDAAPLERQRLRASLLREANARIVSTQRTRATRWLPFAAALVVALVGAAVWIARARVAVPVATNVATPPKFDVASISGAVWRSRTDGATATIDLVDGAASFAVPHLEGAQRFVVSLPDGEIEVRGTRFDVTVEDGVTRDVTVAEGRVVLRRRGDAELALRAGDHWSKIAPVLPPDVVAPSAPTSSHAHSLPRATPSAAPSASSAPSAASRFAEAMAAFRGADYANAEPLLARFVVDFPNDSRREDAAYLRVVARWRLGDRPGAAALARAYIDAYPQGLRRVEAQRMIDAP